MKKEQELHDFIQSELESKDITFDSNVGISGVASDFLIYVPDGRKFAVDLKYWDKFDGFTTLAAKQSELYSSDIGVDRAFIIVESLERSDYSTGVVSPDKFMLALNNAMAEKETTRISKSPTISKSPEKIIFAAMPFDKKYQDVFFVAMAMAAKKANAVCKRVDQEEFSGDIVEKIKNLIDNSVAVIADLSESKPNVLYEVGYAHGKPRPTIHICSTPFEELPFDISHWNTIKYIQGQTYKLGEKIYSQLKAIL